MTFAYEGHTLPVSRRQSMGYSGGYPYNNDYQGVYDEPVIPGLAEPGYQTYTPHATPLGHRLTGPAYDDLALRDSFYPVERQISPIGYPGGVIPHPSIRTPHRHRRHSTISLGHLPPAMNMFRHPSSINIKFKRSGALLPGISLREAQAHVRLSNNDLYTVHDLHPDFRGRILLKVRWVGYSHMTYEIPVEGYDGRVSLQTLARRISRACVHYLQANIVPIAWDRVTLHHIEEISMGTWKPMLSAY